MSVHETDEIYRLAYDEAVRTLEAQARRLSDARGRLLTFVALSTAALAFFAKAVLDERGEGFWFVGLVAVGATGYFAGIGTAVMALRPVQWYGDSRPKKLIEMYADGGYTASETYHFVAEDLDDAIGTNKSMLESLQSQVLLTLLFLVGAAVSLSLAALIAVNS